MTKQTTLELADYYDNFDGSVYSTPAKANAVMLCLLQEAAEELRRLHEVNAELLEAIEMVRDADDDCKRDGLQTIPPSARSKIDQLWQQAMRESIEAGEQFTRYRFAALVAAHAKAEERERCAKVCDAVHIDNAGAEILATECSAAIRAKD